MYLLSPKKMQFKANLHCHSTCSDGRLTPIQLKTAYRDRGYSVLAITDHESPKDHSDLSEKDFLMITGYEAYIRTSPDCVYDVFAPEIHMNLYAKEPHNESLICYNPAYCKYLSAEQQQQLIKHGSEQARTYTVEYINEFIRTANENGYLVTYNHPVWSMESEERLLQYEGILSMEMINGNSYAINQLEHNGALYNTLLRNGKPWFVHASDDNHNVHAFDDPQCDSFRAFTMILAESLDYRSVIDAIQQGDMYASSGPSIYEITIEGDRLHISCSDAAVIICHDGSKHPPAAYATNGECIQEATFTIREQAPFVRISVVDRYGGRADTRGYMKTEWTT